MRTSRFLAPLLALCLALAALPALAADDPPCSPGLGIGLVEFPRGSKDPRARSYIVDHVKAGTQFSRRFQVCNGTSTPLTVSLYPVAATVGNGSFALGLGHAANELSSWITVEPDTLTVPPGGRLLARATLDVPADAETGERYAVVVAERPGNPKQGLPVGSRVGIRVYLDVGSGSTPRSEFTVDSLQASRDGSGTAQVTAQVHNTGKRAVDLTGSLLLRDGPDGQKSGPYPAELGTTLAPGETEPVVVPISSDVADGPWTAQLTVRSGVTERRVQAPLTFPDAAGDQGPPVDVEALPTPNSNEINPLPVLGVGALVVALALAAVVRRRRTGAIRAN
ncbi:MAG: hypothetical protein QOE05_2866 [Actinomycetota bacterium]|nr:hypothetical protein [Actinomycetota bacterium]